MSKLHFIASLFALTVLSACEAEPVADDGTPTFEAEADADTSAPPETQYPFEGKPELAPEQAEAGSDDDAPAETQDPFDGDPELAPEDGISPDDLTRNTYAKKRLYDLEEQAQGNRVPELNHPRDLARWK